MNGDRDTDKKASDKDRKNNGHKKEPVVAPGFDDERFGEDATEEDIKNGNYTRVTRVFLDENDPS